MSRRLSATGKIFASSFRRVAKKGAPLHVEKFPNACGLTSSARSLYSQSLRRGAVKNFMPSTQIILTENIPGLGAEADVVKVKRGFARNFLLPQGKAFEVTKASMRKLDMLKAKRAEREAKELNEAEETSRRIGKSKMIFTLETGESGKAFGSVTANDIASRLKNEVGVEIDRHRIHLEHPIKSTGEHEIAIKLHADVTATMKFTVKSATEPKPQTEEEPEPGTRTRPPRTRDRK